MRPRPFPAPEVRLERSPLAAVRERWLDLLPFDHATLPAPTGYGRDGAKFLVERQSLLRRRIAEGRIPTVQEPALLFRAAASLSALQSIGFSACAEDPLEATCDVGRCTARLWVTRTPAGVVLPGARSSPGAARDELRRLREMVAVALAGDEPVEGPLPLGISGLSLCGQGEEVLRLGRPESPSAAPEAAILRAGSEEYALRLWPPVSSEIADAVALVVETLLFRPQAAAPPTEFAEGWRRFGVVTADTAMEEPFRRLTRFAPRAMTVLVLGESGSGKEAVARAVHALSPRAGGPFVAVNVSAIPAALVESDLFGHARGAFTGAERDRAGLLEEAGRGTIFFDEIGDLAAPLQSKLLRALQDREIRRVGENRARRIDVRVVSATSRDLGREVEAGRFREDLYYRLHVAVIRLPPLRERGRDALLLARHFLAQCAKEYGRLELELAPDACAAVLAHPWPGNVRELQSAITQAAALADGRRIAAALLPAVVGRATRAGESGCGYRARVNAHRRDLIMEALDRAGGNRSRAARDLRLSRQALLYLIRELKVEARPV
jgi:two-component system, NtrC family, response regulator AtoC